LTTEKEQEERWAKHFQEILNKEAPEELATPQDAEEDLDIGIEPPTKEEIMAAIRDLKNGKAPGQDQLNAVLFKCHSELAAGYYSHSLLKYGMVREVTGEKVSSYQFLKRYTA